MGSGAKGTHLRSHVGNVEPIHERQHGPIERSQRQRCASGAKLGSIFAQGHIAAMMGAIFKVPMGARQREKAPGVSLVWGEAADAVHDLLRTQELVRDAPADDEDLSDACPVLLKKRVKQGRRPDAPFFEPSMPFIAETVLLPFVGLGLRIDEKSMDVLPEGGMILFHKQDVVAAKADHVGTKGALGVQGISGHNAIFDQGRAEPAG